MYRRVWLGREHAECVARGLNTLRLDRQALNAGRIVIVEGSHGRETAEYASCGKPALGVIVRIRDPDSCPPSAPLGIGEICIGGASVTRGYWNNQEATRHLFCSDGDAGNGTKPLIRTGDLGFLHAGELYVCGRIKDLIKVRGANFFPDDLEAAIDTSGAAVRPRGCCAFQTLDGRVVILVEPMRVDDMPDPASLARWVRKSCGLLPDFLGIVPPRTIAITTSGKIGRADTRALFLSGNVQVLAAYRSDATPDGAVMNPSTDWRAAVRRAYSQLGIADDNEALADLGVDSLGLTELQVELEEALRRFGSSALAEALDAPLLQRLSLRDLLSVLEPLDRGTGEGARAAFDALTSLRASTDDAIRAQMLLDKYRPLPSSSLRSATHSKGGQDILLTGATGFFGPFLLDELLRQSGATIHVLVRASGSEHAMERIEAALRRARLPTSTRRQTLRNRVRPVCGDLSLPKWGLTDAQWDALARRVGEVYHNGACVNYVMTYEAMRGANIDGTHTALQLAFDSGARTLHLVSSTFIFGWTAKDVLLETDCNIENAGARLRVRPEQMGGRAAGDPRARSWSQCQDLPAIAHFSVDARCRRCRRRRNPSVGLHDPPWDCGRHAQPAQYRCSRCPGAQFDRYFPPERGSIHGATPDGGPVLQHDGPDTRHHTRLRLSLQILRYSELHRSAESAQQSKRSRVSPARFLQPIGGQDRGHAAEAVQQGCLPPFPRTIARSDRRPDTFADCWLLDALSAGTRPHRTSWGAAALRRNTLKRDESVRAIAATVRPASASTIVCCFSMKIDAMTMTSNPTTLACMAGYSRADAHAATVARETCNEGTRFVEGSIAEACLPQKPCNHPGRPALFECASYRLRSAPGKNIGTKVR
jgi:Male sterility protein